MADAEEREKEGRAAPGPATPAAEPDCGAPEADGDPAALQDLVCKWRGREYPLTLPVTATVGDVKLLLEAETDVLAHRQKVLGLVRGKLPPDETVLADLLPLPPIVRFMMMGTPEEAIPPEPDQVQGLPEVVDDLSWDYRASASAALGARFRPENQMKLQRRIRRSEINIINPLREGKRLLVLDLDYTLIDHKARGVDSLSDIERPFLAEFLASVYADYDICVWSQTSWVWLEAKVTELGMMSSPRYKISFLLDRSFMFSIKSKVRGREREHEVKALDVIWAKLPQFSAKNTIHIDDLSRNGAMNPQSLLQITPYKDCLTARHSDHELLFLARYLKIISGAVPDFSSLDHEAWRQYPGVERDLPPPDDRE